MPLTPDQQRRRARIERGIRLAAPVLDLLLWTGDRFSRVIGREDPAYEPPRPPRPDSPVRAGSARPLPSRPE